MPTRDLGRLLRPATIAVVGGGAWCKAVLTQLASSGYRGKVWHVHPTSGTHTSIAALPAPPDAAFVGVNRDATLEVLTALSASGCGGAVCFAAGFAEVADGGGHHAGLLTAARQMPILGPNCYGFINALDGILLWPDQHGCVPVKRGVAILTQSSNIAINMTMQARALPIAYVITCGNQAQTGQAAIALDLLDDPRVTAIGLHIEGLRDMPIWQTLARKARAQGVPLVALKVGRSEAAQLATVSHTAALAGADTGAQALFDRFGIARVDDLEAFLETLKILHHAGSLPQGGIATVSCSGGEASLAADLAQAAGLRFPALLDNQKEALNSILGPRVSLANPLDYNTYIWRDTAAMTQVFAAMTRPDLAMTILIADFPRRDRCDPADWDCVIDAAIAARKQTGNRLALCATLPELLPEETAQRLAEAGVIPLHGLRAAMHAIAAAQMRPVPDLATDILLPVLHAATETLTEAEAKAVLAVHGLTVPHARRISEVTMAALAGLTFPMVLKAEGIVHKTDGGAVALNLNDLAAVKAAANRMPASVWLAEEMVTQIVAELLVGVVSDSSHGFIMTLGAGGILTELLADTVSVSLPISLETAEQSLLSLRCAPLLMGYRGQPAADMTALLDAIMAIQSYVITHANAVVEVEVNPLICTPTAAIAVDALIRRIP